MNDEIRERLMQVFCRKTGLVEAERLVLADALMPLIREAQAEAWDACKRAALDNPRIVAALVSPYRTDPTP